MSNNVSQNYLDSLIGFARVGDSGGIDYTIRRLDSHFSSDVPTYIAEGLIGLKYLANLRDYQGLERKAIFLRNLLDTREVQAVEA